MLYIKIDKDGKPIDCVEADGPSGDIVEPWPSDRVWYEPIYKDGKWIEAGEPPKRPPDPQPTVEEELANAKKKIEVLDGALMELMEAVYKGGEADASNANRN